MKILSKYLVLIFLLGVGVLFIQAVYEPPTNAVIERKLINDYKIYAIPIPEKMDFAGEKVPLNNPDIKERMDRELLVNTYWQSNGLLLIKRANKYFPIIEPLLKKYGIPDDFKYLAVAESGLQNNVSHAGAAGFWHFMKATGKEYGLEINSYVDERYHIEIATRVAAEYLIKAKERFGSWTLAAASYNAGISGISKQQNRQLVTDSYYDLLLNDETSRYLFRILAFKEILSNPHKYGFNYRESDLYKPIPTYKVKVDTAVTDFAVFAKKFKINYKILKIHNPWLRDNFLKNSSGKQYFIDIPEEGYYNLTR